MKTRQHRPSARPGALIGSAAVAVLTAAALLGGPATLASWSDTAHQDEQRVTSASGLTLAVSATGASYDIAAAFRPTSTKATSTTGLVPGIRGQRLTYSMTTGATDGVHGRITGTVTASARTAWAAIYSAGYLDVIATASGKCSVNPTPTVTANSLTWTFSTATAQTLRPGDTCSVVLDLSIPAVKNGVDVSRTLRTSRGTGTTLNPLADFVVAATVTQVPRAEEK